MHSILTNGKILHSNIETFLRGKSIEDIPVAEANQGHWSSLSGILTSVDHVHVLESHVIHPQLQYCGIVDCVAEFRNRLVLIDWKTSQKPKPLVSMTYDTPLQIAAYIGAINYDPKYSLKINDGMIVVAYEDGSSCQTFLLNSVDIAKYWKLWLQRLRRFRMLNPPI
ncbi:Mitochondrial genome maintenance exonuclease 1 [Orchesella cincta]|uniref:Mitochondrial genome maintenance exonuclease 1 n=1 Tax=Orchesella cincta TaxID=48709 RepID=A0A1D2N6D4_ORCCI|nr:Mitochondrial genome maintenance exonuclease 1 [Orchesella cincta]